MDRKLYKKHMQETLFNYSNLDVHVGTVFDLVFSHPDPTSAAPRASRWGTIQGVKLGKPVNCRIRLPLTYQF